MKPIYVPAVEETDQKKQNRSLQAIAGQLSAEWTTFTPTALAQTGTITTLGTLTGRYFQIGKIVHAWMDVPIVAAGAATGYLRISLPVTAKSNFYAGISFEYNTVGKSGAAVIIPSVSSDAVLARVADGTSFIVSGYSIATSITYETAS